MFSCYSLRNRGKEVKMLAMTVSILKYSVLSCGLWLGLCTIQKGFAHGDHSHTSAPKEHQTTAKQQSEITVTQDIQSHLGILSQKVAPQNIKSTVRLVGQVMSDPSGYARLQATQNARVMNDPDYVFPLPGQIVKKDQIVLLLQPTLNKVEFSEQKSALYKIESEIEELRKEVNRKEKLGQYASRKDLDKARTELERAIKQKEEIITKTFKPEYLKSPINGILADLHVRPGEIVTPDKTIIEIVDPSKLLVEAFVFNPEVAINLTGGTARLPLYPDKSIHLKVLGISPKVNKEDQSIHVIFKVEDPNPFIKLDMAVEIIGDLRATHSSIAIPRKAIVEDAKGSWVFIRKNPDHFEPRQVRVGPLHETWAEIEDGLSYGEDVVVEGAFLLNQARYENK
jgi:cobalt-zinc-cadmium efflux system membrane fusion protein